MWIPETVHKLYLPYPEREDRLVRVLVPAHEAGETFPVVYMTDGQNLFDEESSGFGCWHTPELLRTLRAETGRSVVIVGIHNEDPWRPGELTPASIGPLTVPEEQRNGMTPSGEVFDDFLVHTVMPAVEARFPVKPGREHRAFCGSSCGGMMAFFTALSHPELYCAAGVFSPAFLLFRPEDLARWIREHRSKEPPFLYLYTGAGEELEQQICDSTLLAAEVLRRVWPPEALQELVLPEQRHHETAWEPRFRDFLALFLAQK